MKAQSMEFSSDFWTNVLLFISVAIASFVMGMVLVYAMPEGMKQFFYRCDHFLG